MLWLLLCFLVQSDFTIARLQEQYSWSILDYAYPSAIERQQAILNQQFIPENNLPVGIEVWKNKLFVSVPRWRPGIPSTLNYIPLDVASTKSPPLIPYPDWETNELGNCVSGMSTVYRIKADSCDRLWVLDTGTYGIDNTTQNLCPYTLNVFDLRTDRLLRKYQLRPEDINANTFIANIAIDEGNTCEDFFAYMSDELGYGLIAYSWKENRSWRFSHGFFMPDPLEGDFNIGGLNFQWSAEGIFGMSLSPRFKDGSRYLYFSALTSNKEFAVSTSILRNSSKVDSSYKDFILIGDRGPLSHLTSQVMDTNAIQFFNLIDRNAVGCWNSRNPYGKSTIGIVAKDDEALIFPADVKVDRLGYVWVISDKMSTFLLSTLNYNEVNFRIFFDSVSNLIENTVCSSKKPVYTYTSDNYNYLLNYFVKNR